jgi:hypothetical protein
MYWCQIVQILCHYVHLIQIIHHLLSQQEFNFSASYPTNAIMNFYKEIV